MRYLALLAAVGLILAVSGTAGAVTFIFDPNDLVDQYDQGPPLGTPDPDYPRSVYTGGTLPYAGYQGIGAWNTAGHGSPMDLAIKSDYLNWRDNNGGYVTNFNIWLADNPRARGWGETLVIEPNTGLSATADSAGLWTVEVSTNEWHSDLYYAEWAVVDSGDALKIGGTDIGEFSFSADLYVDANENGWDATDPLAVLGQDYTIWFGGYAGNNSYDPADGFILYQGTLDITAIPEPLTMLGMFLGLGSVGAYIRRRRMR